MAPTKSLKLGKRYWENALSEDSEGEVRDNVQFVVGTLQEAREAIQSALAVAFEEGFRNIS